jgi:hypothetical protein
VARHQTISKGFAMDDSKRLNVDACNLEQMRAALRQVDANFVELYDEFAKLRADFDALLTQLGHLAAHPT